MAEDKIDGTTWRQLLPWTLLFRAFQVTLDLNKLLLAAGGIVVTWLAWLVLSLPFTAYLQKPKDWDSQTYQEAARKNGQTEAAAWKNYRRDLDSFNLMYEAIEAGPVQYYDLADVAETSAELEELSTVFKPGMTEAERRKAFDEYVEKKLSNRLSVAELQRFKARWSRYARIGQPKPAGRLVVNPWSEDRGPNPYLLMTGQAGVPWEASGLGDWFLRDQLPVMLEPLVKLVRPIVFFLSPRNDFWSRLYFFLIIASTVLTWSFFGGAITRIAAVQIARGERIGLMDAVRFTSKRFLSFVTAPMFPLAVVAIAVILLSIFGLLGWIPYIGEILIAGLLWVVPLLFGLLMTMALVGLIGWPLMAAVISTEGTDSWEAVTRAYGYVFQRPWQYAWYGLVSVVYGGLVIFIVGFLGSMTVYMAKWGVGLAPQTFSRGEANYPRNLFVYAPTSFGWRELLLEGATVELTGADKDDPINGAEVVAPRSAVAVSVGTVGGVSRWSRINESALKAYKRQQGVSDTIAAGLVGFWLGLAFLLVLAFGYVFFWTASTITYLLLRKSLESAELDEVFMEEDDYEASFRAPAPAPAPVAAPVPAPAAFPSPPSTKAASLPIIEAPPPPPPAPIVQVAPPPEPPKPATPPPAADEPPPLT